MIPVSKKRKNSTKIDLSQLYEYGYQVLKKRIAIDPKVKDHLIKITNQKNRQIFNHNEKSKKNDGKRRQKNVTARSQYMVRWMDHLNHLITELFPQLEQNDWVCIKSLPGCKPQAAHTDFPFPERPIENHQIPVNVMVALQDRTYLNVWPRSHNIVAQEYLRNSENRDTYGDTERPRVKTHDYEKIQMEIIELEEGDILLFRGDLVHGGAGYDTMNHRLHCFLDYEHRIPNRTWLVSENGSEYLRNIIAIDHL